MPYSWDEFSVRFIGATFCLGPESPKVKKMEKKPSYGKEEKDKDIMSCEVPSVNGVGKATEPDELGRSFQVYVRDTSSAEADERYGCRVFYQGGNGPDRSIGEWREHFDNGTMFFANRLRRRSKNI